MPLSIKQIIKTLDETELIPQSKTSIYGWVRTVRSSSNILGFCVLNDGSTVNGMQIVLSSEYIAEDKIEYFFKNVNTGAFLTCTGNMIMSPANGQKYEMKLKGLLQKVILSLNLK